MIRKKLLERAAADRLQREKFHAVIEQTVLWKGQVLERYIAAILTAAEMRRLEGCPYVGPSDVPEGLQPKAADFENAATAQGVIGAAWRLLTGSASDHQSLMLGQLKAPILQRFYGNAPRRRIFMGRRTSPRVSRNGANEAVYVLLQAGRPARAWLSEHGYKVPEKREKELL